MSIYNVCIGDQAEAGPNLVYFINKLKSMQPDFIISQPTYGYPQVVPGTWIENSVCTLFELHALSFHNYHNLKIALCN